MKERTKSLKSERRATPILLCSSCKNVRDVSSNYVCVVGKEDLGCVYIDQLVRKEFGRLGSHTH